MGNVDTNRQRAFAEVVSIDAWHEPFSNKKAKVALHADVIFRTGRLGGELESRVEFRLSIKRAELVLIGPGQEPLSVDKASVARFGDAPKITRTTTNKLRGEGSLGGSAGFSASPHGTSPSIELAAGGKLEREFTEELKRTERLSSITFTCWFHNADSRYHWMLKPEIDTYMEGRPWNPVDNPLAMLVDERRNRTKGLAPSARLEMICLREDLEISDIELKDDNAMQRLLHIVGSQNKIKAAEAYIRNQLEETGMEVGDLSDKYTNITLADVFADNSRNG